MFNYIKGQSLLHKALCFARVGEDHLSYAVFPVLFAEKLFSRLEPVIFRSQKSNLTIASKAHPLDVQLYIGVYSI